MGTICFSPAIVNQGLVSSFPSTMVFRLDGVSEGEAKDVTRNLFVYFLCFSSCSASSLSHRRNTAQVAMK